MYNDTTIEKKSSCCCGISWSAIISGSVVGIGLCFLFHLLTSGIGLTSMTQTVGGTQVLVAAVLLWLYLGNYLIFFISGWVTGKLARRHCSHACTGLLYGFMAWAVALIISMALFAQVSSQNTIEIFPSMNSVTLENRTLGARASGAAAVVPPESANKKAVIVDHNTQDVIQKVGVVNLAIFLVFFSGALGGAIGGYYALRYGKDKCDNDTRCGGNTTTTIRG